MTLAVQCPYCLQDYGPKSCQRCDHCGKARDWPTERSDTARGTPDGVPSKDAGVGQPPKAARCCAIGCTAPAIFRISGLPEHFEDYTEACERHVGGLLGTPTWKSTENTRWVIVALSFSDEKRAEIRRYVASIHHYGCPPDSRLQADVDGDVDAIMAMVDELVAEAVDRQTAFALLTKPKATP